MSGKRQRVDEEEEASDDEGGLEGEQGRPPTDYTWEVVIDSREQYDVREVEDILLEMVRSDEKYRGLSVAVRHRHKEAVSLTAGDITIRRKLRGVQGDPKVMENCCMIEIKRFDDLSKCLGANHKHLRSQLNTMRRKSNRAADLIWLSICDETELQPSQFKAKITLDMECAFGSQRVLHPRNIKSIQFLPHFILAYIMKSTLKRVFDESTLEELNEGVSRRKAQDPGDQVELFFRNIRGIGEGFAAVLARHYRSQANLVDQIRQSGLEAFAAFSQVTGKGEVKKKRNEVISPAMAGKIITMLGLPLPEKVKPTPSKRSAGKGAIKKTPPAKKMRKQVEPESDSDGEEVYLTAFD